MITLMIFHKYQQSLLILFLSVQAGVPIPAFSSAISYYDSYRSERLPAILFKLNVITGAHMNASIKQELSILIGMGKMAKKTGVNEFLIKP